MRIIELLAYLRELLSSELRSLVDALPSALNALREALQATVDQCVAVFTGDALTHQRPRRVRYRHRRIGKRNRLSRMNASGNLLCAVEANAMAAEPVNALMMEQQVVLPPSTSPRLNETSRPSTPLSLSLADIAYAHDLVDRASRVEDIENDEERGAHAQAVAADIQQFLGVATGNIQEPVSVAGDDADVSFADGNASIHSGTQDDASPPPSSELSDWNDALPGEAGVSPMLPPGWNTNWKMNAYAALHTTSSCSEASSVCDFESEAPILVHSVGSAPSTSPPGSSQSISDAVMPWRSTVDAQVVNVAVNELEKTDDEQAEPVVSSSQEMEESIDVPSSPMSTASSTSSSRSLALFTNGVSYRQLAQELAPHDEESDDTSAFYRAALQKLKEERKLRARIRAESMTSEDGDDGGAQPNMSAVLSLGGLRAMQVTPMQPQYDNEDDASRGARKKKLESLRTRTTAFAIKVGQPLSVKSLLSDPEHDAPYFA